MDTMRSRYIAATLQVPCDTCGAGSGRHCVSELGRKVQSMHAARRDEAIKRGYWSTKIAFGEETPKPKGGRPRK